MFAVVCIVAALVAVFSVVRARSDAKDPAATFGLGASTDEIAAVESQPYVVTLEGGGFRYGRVALRPPTPAGIPALTSLGCFRVYFAAGSGLCLGSDGARGGAFGFDASMNVTHRYDIAGLPTRVRVSPDGRYGAMTVFVSGHSYLDIGFSTRTMIVDLRSGETVIDNLESLAVYKDGKRFDAIDFNYWGVTFEDDANRFYATLQSGGSQYLIRGDIAAGRAEVLKENVECPSLSPDGTRIAFKKRVKSGFLGESWRLHILDLRTMTEHQLPEERSVDDQVEWLDDAHVLYFVGDDTSTRTDIWMTETDTDAPPVLYWEGASSPAVFRGP